MSYLLGYVIAAMVGSVAIVNMLKYIFSSISDNVANAVGCGVWTSILAGQGMRSFSRRMRGLHRIFRKG